MRILPVMRIATLALALLLTTSATAQKFVAPEPDASRFTVQKNIVYATPDGQVLALDFYRPAGNAVVPVVITCNVGISGMKDWNGYVGWGKAIAAAGLASVHYDARNNRGVDDFDALVAFLRTNAGEYRIDPSRIVVWGGSANVRLALPVAMDAKRDDIRGGVIFYGDAEVPEVRTDVPVYFVRSGLDDAGLNRRIDTLISRALAANAPWTIDNYGGGLHGFDVHNDNDLSRELIDRALRFMQRVTAPELARVYASTSADAALGGAFSRGDWAAAVAGYQQRVTANPNDAESHRRLGIALLESNRAAEALPLLEAAYRLGRGGPRDTMFPAASAAARSGNRERALHWIDAAVATPFVRIDEFRKDPAFASLATAIDARAAALAERQRLIEALTGSGRADALATLRNAPADSPHGREAALNTIGYAALNAGAIDAAIDVFRLATVRYPKSANTWDSLSEALERAGKHPEALTAAKQVLVLTPTEFVRNSASSRVARLSK